MESRIPSYPTRYHFSDEELDFYKKVSSEPELQARLRQTKTLHDVAVIAYSLGFEVSGGQILKAQAGRVLAILQEDTEDVARLLSGEIPKTGAQWGRGGHGYLDDAGLWLEKLSSHNALNSIDKKINTFLKVAATQQLENSKNFLALAALMTHYDCNIDPKDLLRHQAQKILALPLDQANILSNL